MATEITYNGNVIASLSEGQTATLACSGKKAKSDIVVSFDSEGNITYNGIKTDVETGKTAALACAGKNMLTDVVVLAELALNRLGTPTISLNGDTLTITGMVENAQRYGIYIDGVKQATVADPVNG